MNIQKMMKQAQKMQRQMAETQEALAAQTVEGLTNMANWVAQDVLAVLRGDYPRNPVNDPAQVEASRRRRQAGGDPQQGLRPGEHQHRGR